jgi:hypothetical protein
MSEQQDRDRQVHAELPGVVQLVRITFVYQITYAEPVKLTYGPIRFLPWKAAVTVVDGKTDSVKVEGPRAKKDGTAGKRWFDNRYRPGSAYRQDEIAAWVLELAARAEQRYAAMTSAVEER